MIYLYLKTHNITGKKYLGKTVADPFTYKGSGTVWRRHLKVHGNDVTTEILFESNDKAEFCQMALFFSQYLNVVKSTEFTNIVPEAGGDTSMSPAYIAKKHLPGKPGDLNPMKNPIIAEKNHKAQRGQVRIKTSESAKITWKDPVIKMIRQKKLGCLACKKEVTIQNFHRHYQGNRCKQSTQL